MFNTFQVFQEEIIKISTYLSFDYFIHIFQGYLVQLRGPRDLYYYCDMTMSQDSSSLAPGRSECDFKNVIFILVLLIGVFRSSHDNAL